MTDRLQILMVASLDETANAMAHELENAGYEVAYRRVNQTADLEAALAESEWDAVLCEFGGSCLDVEKKLAVVARRRPEIPFLLIGQGSEEPGAVGLLRAGAVDFIPRENPCRLVASIERERRSAEQRRQSRETSAALTAKERQMQLLLDSTAEGICGLDRDGRCIWANQACARMLGHASTEALVGKPFHEQIHGAPLDHHSHPLDDCQIRSAYQRGEALHVEDEHFQRADGSRIHVEWWSHPIRSNGTLLGAVLTFVDISSRVKRDEQVRKLSQAIEQSASSVAITDIHGNLEYVNQRFTQTTGYSAAEVLGKNPRMLKSGKHPPEFYERLWNTIYRGDSWRGEICNRKKNGELYWEATSITPLRGSDGKISHFVAVKEEITAAKQERAVNELLHRIDQTALSGGDLNALMPIICDCLADLFLLPLVWIGMKEEDGSVRIHSRGGLLAAVLDGTNPRWDDTPEGKGLVAEALRTNQVQLLPANGPEHPCCGLVHGAGVRTGMAVPFAVKARVIGAIVMCSDRPAGFSAEIQRHLSGLAVRVSMALERAFDQQQLRLQGVALASAGNAVIITDAEGRIQWVNDSFTHLSGFSLDEARGQTPRLLKSGRHDLPFYQQLWDTILAGKVWRSEVTDRRKDGHVYVVEETITPLCNAAGQITNFVAIQEDVTARKQAEARIEYLSQHDALTGLPNAAVLRTYLPLALAQARRTGQMLGILILDLDRFNVINESLGHRIGDLALEMIAARLQGCVGATDIVARVGGDEFAIVQNNVPNVGATAGLAEKLLAALAEPVVVQGHELHVGGSIGISVFPIDESDPEQLLKNADLAMYQAKREGRNTFQFFSSALNVGTQDRMTLEREMRRALTLNQFRLWYQPQVEVASGKVIGLEALVRWQHPERGLISPATFIAIAEESGLIVPLGDWVLGEACRANQAWQAAGLSKVRVAVNLSALQFKRGGLLDSIREHLRATRLDPRYLELEVTESLIMEDAQAAAQVMEQLHQLGIQIALDDFGTGYSSLSYLKRFPLDKLKIDQSFVRDLDRNTDAALIVRAIIGLGQSLGLQVIAEGVERASQLAFLRDANCLEIQGYYFSPPMPAEKIPTLLRHGILHGKDATVLSVASAGGPARITT